MRSRRSSPRWSAPRARSTSTTRPWTVHGQGRRRAVGRPSADEHRDLRCRPGRERPLWWPSPSGGWPTVATAVAVASRSVERVGGTPGITAPTSRSVTLNATPPLPLEHRSHADQSRLPGQPGRLSISILRRNSAMNEWSSTAAASSRLSRSASASLISSHARSTLPARSWATGGDRRAGGRTPCVHQAADTGPRAPLLNP